MVGDRFDPDQKVRDAIATFRWVVIALLFTATLINFINRLTVAMLSPVLIAQFHLSSTQFASLTTCFLIAYTISQGVSGKLFDVVGTRIGFLVSVALWSLCAIAQAGATSLFGLNTLRFMLGLGEGGTWPGTAKAIAEWFPPRERALVMGICNSGTAIGSLIATPLLIALNARVGWRLTFVACGLAAVLWLVLWGALYPQTPSPETAELIAHVHAVTPKKQPALRAILRRREAWAIMVARFFGDPVWWFYVTWLPLYLFRARHFTLTQIGMFAWIPFAAADAGSLCGGWLSGHLLRLGWSVDRARKTVIVCSMFLMLGGIPAAMTTNPLMALALIAAVLFGFQSWIGNVQTLSSDYFPSSAVATAMGLGGVGAGLGAMALTEATGVIVDRYSYTPIFIGAGLLPIVATLLLLLLGGTIKAIPTGDLIAEVCASGDAKAQ